MELGRVLVPLTNRCGYIQGIDKSSAMVDLCSMKLKRAEIPATKADVRTGDISNFDLNQKFDLIIAPYRVVQNLETDDEVSGLFHCIYKHLSTDGTCILNVFKPNRDAESLRKEWCSSDETFCWEKDTDGKRVSCHDRRPKMDSERLVLYPELIYREYDGDRLVDETILKIAMRCYYPDEFDKLVCSKGFKIVNRWGGYSDEKYGFGPELILQFKI